MTSIYEKNSGILKNDAPLNLDSVDSSRVLKSCIREGRVFWTYHVNMRLKGHYITCDQIFGAIDTFEIIEDYPDDKYLPSCLVWSMAGDDIIHVHMALDRVKRNVRIITSYWPTVDKWTTNFKTRRKT
jgi:hypothetical protein